MLHRSHKQITFECDSCDQVLETETDDFLQAKRMFDREGWKAHQIGQHWVHGCPVHKDVR